MRLRRATEADLEALLDVQQEGAVRALAHIFDQELHPFPREVLAERWRTEMASSEVDVHLWVDDAGAVLGFGAVKGRELLHLGTAWRTWGTGAASALHDALLPTMGAGTTTLTLRVFEDNHRARRFYAKHGWRPTGTSSRSTFPPYALLLEYQHRPATT